MLGKISFHKHFKIINRVAYFVFICNNNSKSTKPYIITNAHIYERLSGCQDAFASLASVADDLGGGGGGIWNGRSLEKTLDGNMSAASFNKLDAS